MIHGMYHSDLIEKYNTRSHIAGYSHKSHADHPVRKDSAGESTLISIQMGNTNDYHHLSVRKYYYRDE
ncbi:hypothetical protein KAZ93_00640 [Patescibacteria group bacterium]|nr:hypothetical protein [Patescibacteria group bacterium]